MSGAACPLVAITGTNGKSTTTALIAHLLKSAGIDAQMGGNIGVPVLALEDFAPGRAYVLEVSSYQIDLAPSLKPTVGILLNVSEDHLDRHGTIENYAAIKTLLAACAEQAAVIGVDDRYTREAAERIERAGRKVVRVSVEAPLRDGYYSRRQPHHPRHRGKGSSGATRRHRLVARRACAQNAASRGRRCVALGLDLPDPEGLVSFRASRTACSRSGARERVVRQRFQSDQCR